MFGKKKEAQDAVEVTMENGEETAKKTNKFTNPFRKKKEENLNQDGQNQEQKKKWKIRLPFMKHKDSDMENLEKQPRKKWSKKKKICTGIAAGLVVLLVVTAVIQANMPEPLETVTSKGELKAYLFDGFWQCMDTKREMDKLNEMWDAGNAPWKKWN